MINALLPPFSVLSTDLMTPTATVCLISRTANRPRGGYCHIWLATEPGNVNACTHFVVALHTLNYHKSKGIRLLSVDRDNATHHRLAWDKLDDASITRFDKFGGSLKRLATPSIDLFNELGEFAGNMGSVTIKDGCVTGADLTRVVENDNLSVERSSLLRRVVLRVGSHVTTTDIFDGDVPKWRSVRFHNR